MGMRDAQKRDDRDQLGSLNALQQYRSVRKMSRKETAHQIAQCSPSLPAVVEVEAVSKESVEESAPALSVPWNPMERCDHFLAHVHP